MNSGGYHPDYAPRTKWRVLLLPIIMVFVGSLLTAWPSIVSAPLLPPLGFMMLLCWRLLRSDVWPIWVGLPLGLIDDLYSGHPIGTAPFAWTMTLIALALLDRRVVYRSWWFEWLVGTLALGFVVLVSALLARAGDIAEIVELVAPQWALSALLLPLFVKMTATTDRWRLS